MSSIVSSVTGTGISLISCMIILRRFPIKTDLYLVSRRTAYGRTHRSYRMGRSSTVSIVSQIGWDEGLTGLTNSVGFDSIKTGLNCSATAGCTTAAAGLGTGIVAAVCRWTSLLTGVRTGGDSFFADSLGTDSLGSSFGNGTTSSGCTSGGGRRCSRGARSSTFGVGVSSFGSSSGVTFDTSSTFDCTLG